jgi:hypothetical protein
VNVDENPKDSDWDDVVASLEERHISEGGLRGRVGMSDTEGISMESISEGIVDSEE